MISPPAFDDLQRENQRLREQIKGETDKHEGYGFDVDDKAREIQQLKGEKVLPPKSLRGLQHKRGWLLRK